MVAFGDSRPENDRSIDMWFLFVLSGKTYSCIGWIDIPKPKNQV